MLTRKEANGPQKIEFKLGKSAKTYSLHVVSVHSDQFKYLRSKFISERVLLPESNQDEASAYVEHEARIVSFAVGGWDMPKKYGDFSSDGAYEFLLEYPEIRDAVNYFIASNDNFEKK